MCMYETSDIRDVKDCLSLSHNAQPSGCTVNHLALMASIILDLAPHCSRLTGGEGGTLSHCSFIAANRQANCDTASCCVQSPTDKDATEA